MLVQHKKVAFYPNSHVAFEGEKIPHWELALEKAKALHKQLYNVHSVGWDIAFFNDDVCFIEGNDDWHVIDIQLAGPRKLVFDRYFKL